VGILDIHRIDLLNVISLLVLYFKNDIGLSYFPEEVLESGNVSRNNEKHFSKGIAR
jgi:hypothetical protein